MKKIFLILSIASVFVSCASNDTTQTNIEPKTKSANGKPAEIIPSTYYSVSAVDYYTNGIHYKVFNSAKGNLFVINITQDSLNLIKR